MEYTSELPHNQVHLRRNDSFIDVENRLRVARYKRYSSRIPRQRVGSLTKILKFRHDGSCRTDDAAVWFDVVVPFVIEVAVIEGRDPLPAVLAWASRFLPGFYAETGHVEIERRMNALVREREAARRIKAHTLPSLRELADLIRLTFEEVTAIGLKGWTSINPPDADTKRARNRDRMQRVRREQGVRSQASRTKTKDDDALAACIGVSRRTILRWRKAGTVADMIRKGIDTGTIDVTKLCALSLLGEYMAHTFATRAPAANDDTHLARSA